MYTSLVFSEIYFQYSEQNKTKPTLRIVLEMQHKAVYLLFCKSTLHVSGVNHIHHQEYTKL